MMKTFLTAACVSTLLAGAALAQSMGTSQNQRRNPLPTPSPATQQRISPQEAEPGALHRSEQLRPGETAPSPMPMQPTPRGAGAGASGGAMTTSSSASMPGFGSCRGMGSEQEVTRCLNQRSAEMVARGMNPDQAPTR